ncbi:hypothetical protein MMC30_008452 [Trapelia coarctata]|nr:hypothetical protein [Trapelia coarctata]
MPDVEFDASDAEFEVSDAEFDILSAPSTKPNQAPTPSTPLPIQWTWKKPPQPPHPRPPRRNPDEPEFSSLSEQVRRAMRTFPHALAVVTSKAPSGLTRGLVVSSFSTVAMYPRPYVTFNIKTPSATYDAIARTKKFTITAIWSAETAKAFANPNKENPIPLEDSDPRSLDVGGLFSMDCKWEKVKSPRVRDHVIMLGRVEEYRPESTGHRPQLRLSCDRTRGAATFNTNLKEEDAKSVGSAESPTAIRKEALFKTASMLGQNIGVLRSFLQQPGSLNQWLRPFLLQKSSAV